MCFFAGIKPTLWSESYMFVLPPDKLMITSAHPWILITRCVPLPRNWRGKNIWLKVKPQTHTFRVFTVRPLLWFGLHLNILYFILRNKKMTNTCMEVSDSQVCVFLCCPAVFLARVCVDIWQKVSAHNVVCEWIAVTENAENWEHMTMHHFSFYFLYTSLTENRKTCILHPHISTAQEVTL